MFLFSECHCVWFVFYAAVVRVFLSGDRSCSARPGVKQNKQEARSKQSTRNWKTPAIHWAQWMMCPLSLLHVVSVVNTHPSAGGTRCIFLGPKMILLSIWYQRGPIGTGSKNPMFCIFARLWNVFDPTLCHLPPYVCGVGFQMVAALQLAACRIAAMTLNIVGVCF